MNLRLFFCFLVTGLTAGCSLNEFNVNLTAPILKGAADSFNAENDVQIAREAAPAQLKTAEGFLASAPKNRDLLEILARGYIEYSFGFLEDALESLPDDAAHDAQRQEIRARATALYERARGYAVRLVELDSKHFGDHLRQKSLDDIERVIDGLEANATAGLLYTGMAMASIINLNRDDLSRVIELPKAVMLIKRSHELDPNFNHANAAMLLGIVYGSQGRAMGGNPDASKKYFDEAIKRTDGKFLLIQVMMSRYFATCVQDRALFESTLKQVASASNELAPDARLPNAIAKLRAHRYLAGVDNYF